MNEQRGLILVLIGLLSAVTFMMVEPLLGYFLGAIILGFMMQPMQKKLRRVVGDRISAFLLVIFGILVVVLPILGIGAAVIEDAGNLAEDLEESEAINTTQIEQRLAEYTGQNFDIETSLDSFVSTFTNTTLGGFSQIVTTLTEIAIGVTLLIFLLYYLLKDGEKFVKWLRDTTPLPSDIQNQLYARVNKTTWAVIKGNVLVAVVQGLIAGLGLAITGVPNYAFWTFIMVILGFIPIIGTVVVWLPAAAYLFAIDRSAAAIFLFLYGMVIVGLTDNILRPIAVDRGSNLHPAVIIIGVIGGVYIFGAAGLFIGPIILGIFKAVLLVFKNNYEDL
jgi:predicted PurR-regulated permease PerM